MAKQCKINTEAMINDFLSDSTRYQIVIRGQRMLITDMVQHKDIVEMKFNNNTKALVQQEMEQICSRLNNNEILIRR